MGNNFFLEQVQLKMGVSLDEYKEYLSKGMKEIEKFININGESNLCEFDSLFNDKIHLYRIGMYLILDLAFYFVDQIDYENDKTKVKPLEFLEPKYFSSKFQFSLKMFLFTLFNTLLSIEKLLSLGLGHDAKILTRYYMETTELIIALVYDSDLYEIYMKDLSDENEYQKWKNNFSPVKIRKIITKYENNIMGGFNLNEFRTRNYKRYSQYVHNDFLSLNLACYGKSLDNEEYLQCIVGGKITQDIQSTMCSVINSTGIFLLYITQILCGIKKLRFYVKGKDDLPFLVALELYKQLYFDYLDKEYSS